VNGAPGDDLLVGDRYYILATSVAADLPKLVLKHDDAFLVADRRGDLPHIPQSEFGFYVDGTRFLSRLELRLHGHRPILLNATVAGELGAVDLTNPDVVDGDRVVLPGRTMRLWRRVAVLDGELHQWLVIESFAREPHELDLRWQFESDFADVFEVRGHPRAARGALLPPRAGGARAVLGYRGLDGVVRRMRLWFDPPPAVLDARTARYALPVAPGGRVELAVTASAALGDARRGRPRSWAEAATARRAEAERLAREATAIRTDHGLVNRWLERSRADVHLLLTRTAEGLVPCAGIPWYVAPFGRDSLLTALQVLPFEPEIARGTLRYLARHQATTGDDFTDREPGKILHEHRGGEMAACREIPFIPYYGTVDATPLFVTVLAEYLRWTADLDLARELWPAAERAVGWMDATAAATGYLTYRRRSPIGLVNQGWKDSHDAIMHASGALADSPIALVEVQGYYHAALRGAAEIAELLGQGARAAGLRERAEGLRARFEQDFWLEDEAYYALALDGHGRPCRVIASNPGHCLWTRIVGRERAEQVAKRLLADELFSGWGVRTLSARESLYNPMSYHNGSVWPHDTAIAAEGLRRYRARDAFLTLATGLFDAVLHFEGLRMPELFCGFPRTPGHGPTRYPVACSPQAWSAGTAFQLVAGMLGLVAEAGSNRLTLDHPQLPPWLDWLEVHGLRVHRSRVALRVTRGKEAAVVEMLEREGDVELLVRR
jgi:glycogen debranching enzyme